MINYVNIDDYIDSIKYSKLYKLRAFITSVILALLFVIAPLLLCINLLIFLDLLPLLIFLIATMVNIIFILINKFYLTSLLKENNFRLRIYYLNNTYYFSIIIYIVSLIINLVVR